MMYFDSAGLRLAYLDEGEGEPILLIHGFASNAHTNWVYPGWVSTLTRAGRRVIAIDNRGHGDSDKPHDSRFYPAQLMAQDAHRLLDHLDIARADVMGYSMGARITAFLALANPHLVRRAIFGGMGMAMIAGMGASQAVIAALEAPELDQISDPQGRAFRRFADATGSDLQALAACMRASRQRISARQISALQPPVLVAVGSDDELAGSPQGLAALIPGSQVLEIPNRDHMLAVGDKVYKSGVLAFLEADR
jgi:pimeloyl-ACP methyl ester carboxylesterase